MKKFAVGMMGLAMVASASVMAEGGGNWYLGGSAASYYLDSDRDTMGGDVESVVAGGQLGFITSGGTAFEAAYQEDVGGDALEAIQFNIVKMLSDNSSLRPYIIGGVTHFDLDDKEIPGLEEDDSLSIHLGVGLSSMLSDNWEVRGDIRALHDLPDGYNDGAVTLGVNYHFVDEHQFHDMLENDEFLEWATVFDHLYGTSIDAARLVLETGKHVILEIDWQGAQQIRQKVSGTQTIFIFPPSLQALRDRLTARAQDDPATIERRTASALEELSHWSEFDYLIVNDDFDTAVSELRDIVAGQGDPFRRDVRQTELKSLVEELLTS